jgi:hypothetical protein
MLLRAPGQRHLNDPLASGSQSMGEAVQATPQQLLAVPVVTVSQPFAVLPSQLPWPGAQLAMTHTPMPQVPPITL